jgi:maltose alpha-D-glucosyltransferase / alpha-amylase
MVEVAYGDGGTEPYCLPMVMVFGRDSADRADGALCRLDSPHGTGMLLDGMLDDRACAALLGSIEHGAAVRSRLGEIRGEAGPWLARAMAGQDEPMGVVRGSAEQSNSSVQFGGRLFLKVFRRPAAGVNPDCEIGRYLTDQGAFAHVPPFAGSLEYRVPGKAPATLALLQGAVQNQGDGWTWTLDELERYFENCATLAGEHAPSPAPLTDALSLGLSRTSPPAVDRLGFALDAGATLGRLTAELHVALASGDGPFSRETIEGSEFQALARQFREHGAGVLTGLKTSLSRLPDDAGARRSSGCSRAWTSRTHLPRGFAFTGTITWGRCCGRAAASSCWTSRASRRGRSRNGEPDSPR